MGAKITFDPYEREFVCIGPPVDGVIEINLNEDVYSDGKRDWVDSGSYPLLSNMKFPVDAKGGEPFGAIILGDSYLIVNGWRFRPYEADHTLRLVGNVGKDDGEELVNDTVGAYRVRVENVVSAIVEVRESGVSGLTPTESQALIDIAADQATITTAIGDINNVLAAQLAVITGIEAMNIAEHITSPTTGLVVIRNTVEQRRWEALGWEDEARTIPYRGEGLEVVGQLTEVAWS